MSMLGAMLLAVPLLGSLVCWCLCIICGLVVLKLAGCLGAACASWQLVGIHLLVLSATRIAYHQVVASWQLQTAAVEHVVVSRHARH
jgi:hypothetical protein